MDDPKTVTVTLDARHVAALDQYAARNEGVRGRSAALRHLLDATLLFGGATDAGL